MNRFFNTENYIKEIIDGNGIEFDSFEMNIAWDEAEQKRNNQTTKLEFSDGDWYEGEEKAGIPNGYGTYTFKRGNFYKGEWLEGVPHGKGAFYYHNHTLAYEGDVRQGRYDGYGSAYYADGSYYVGEWSEGTISGFGYGVKRYGKANEKHLYEYEWIPLSWYVGTWENNVPHGHGRIFIIEPNIAETVDVDHQQDDCWEAVQMQQHLLQMTDVVKNRKHIWYEGEMQNGDLLGSGAFYDRDGDLRFKGEAKGSIKKSDLIVGHIPQWSDDLRSEECDPWIYADGKPIIKLGHGEFYTKQGTCWYTGTMEHAIMSINNGAPW